MGAILEHLPLATMAFCFLKAKCHRLQTLHTHTVEILVYVNVANSAEKYFRMNSEFFSSSSQVRADRLVFVPTLWVS